MRYNRCVSHRAVVLARQGHIEDSLMFRKTTMRRAIAEGALIYTFGLLLALPQPYFWPTPIFIIVLLLRLTLYALPPVWAAMRVVSTKREKMSARFWRLGTDPGELVRAHQRALRPRHRPDRRAVGRPARRPRRDTSYNSLLRQRRGASDPAGLFYRPAWRLLPAAGLLHHRRRADPPGQWRLPALHHACGRQPRHSIAAPPHVVC